MPPRISATGQKPKRSIKPETIISPAITEHIQIIPTKISGRAAYFGCVAAGGCGISGLAGATGAGGLHGSPHFAINSSI